jgi:anti-sigma factor RsiW
MREDDTKTKEGAALWRRARQDGTAVPEAETPDPLWLAAYLDGRLQEDEAARLEAQLAGDPALLDEMLSLRQALAAVPGPVPAAVVARARALRPARPAVRPESAGRPSWLELLLGELGGTWLRPAVAGLALLLACAGAFEMGRYQSLQIDATQTADVSSGATDSDVPVDLLMAGLL